MPKDPTKSDADRKKAEAGVHKMADGGLAPAARAASLRHSIGPELLKTRKKLGRKVRKAIKGFKGIF